MNLYLVRHGESEIPAGQVQFDYPLSPLGREQAARVAERFRGLVLDQLITTPFRRTQETAAAIAATTGVAWMEEPGLGAVDAGELQRTPYEQRRERFPQYYANPSPLQDFSAFGGESAAAFFERVASAFVERIWAANWDQELAVMLVCHAETINAILHHVLGMPFEGWMTFSIDHTSVTLLDVRHRRPRVRYVNNTTHLGDLSRGHRGSVGGEAPRPRPL
jgi:broad specificity phosphatase PhoE